MKTDKNSFVTVKRMLDSVACRSLMLTLAVSVPVALRAEETAKTFATPEEAVSALEAAAVNEDSAALHALFGPAAEDLENPDHVQATNEMRKFTAALRQAKRIVREAEARCVLEVGPENWPFPVPVVKKDGQWFFDAEAGKDELINRRIGRNEILTLSAVRAYVDAQREYAAKDRDGDEVLEYAQTFISAAGLKDGLYWPPELDGEISPLGPLVAQAQGEGYGVKAKEEGAASEPFHGYFFKVITRQAKSAPGGKYDYVINKNMIGGFALVAWPASYGETGVMTFIVNQQGRVYQKDLGADTAKSAPKINVYDPDKSWAVSPD
jgi:hypothetical protein